jgi:hypothetical protein
MFPEMFFNIKHFLSRNMRPILTDSLSFPYLKESIAFTRSLEKRSADFERRFLDLTTGLDLAFVIISGCMLEPWMEVVGIATCSLVFGASKTTQIMNNLTSLCRSYFLNGVKLIRAKITYACGRAHPPRK